MTLNDVTTRNSHLSALSSALGANSKIKGYESGGTLLFVITAVTYGSPSSGSMSVTSSTGDSSNDASGTVNNLKLTTSGDTVIATIASGEITAGTVTAGGTTSLTSLSITI